MEEDSVSQLSTQALTESEICEYKRFLYQMILQGLTEPRFANLFSLSVN